MPKSHAPSSGTELRDEMERLAEFVPKGPMDVEEIGTCLSALGWMTTDLIEAMGFHRKAGPGRSPIFAWASGERQIPEDVGNWLRARAALVSAMPAPPKVAFKRGPPPGRRKRSLTKAEALLASLSDEEKAELLEDVD
jgi:hypothetical protein